MVHGIQSFSRCMQASLVSCMQYHFLLFFFQDLDLDFWSHPSYIGQPVDIRVTTDRYSTLALLLKAQGITLTDHIPDVDEAVAKQTPPGGARAGSFDYYNYNRLPQVCIF